jgi:predicted O-methyltransferase YrrM
MLHGQETVLSPDMMYRLAFHAECGRVYPDVDRLEKNLGFAMPTAQLQDAARVLACPLKAHAPNWQHGRVLYAVARKYLTTATEPVNCVDIGTAKGFSAWCLMRALLDAPHGGIVTSIDVIDPNARLPRNTVAEVDGLKTLREILEPWPETKLIEFVCSTAFEHLSWAHDRVHLAFVDGEHTGTAVRNEGLLLASRQRTGDIVVFDDVHLPGVFSAVLSLHVFYTHRIIEALPARQYAIAVRR